MRWYRMAAERGNAGAMFNIGMMYNRSQGVSLDPRELYFWFYLCSTYPLPQNQADHVRKAIEKLTSKTSYDPTEHELMIEIRERAQQWIKTHPKLHVRAD
jgi:hypothetical protein